jgi:hypothetical protein
MKPGKRIDESAASTVCGKIESLVNVSATCYEEQERIANLSNMSLDRDMIRNIATPEIM